VRNRGCRGELKWSGLAIIAGLAVLGLSLPCGFLFPGLTDGRAVKTCTHDLNRNGIHELYILKNQGLSIIENRETLWRLPAAWPVEHFILANATNDGSDDLVMAVWTPGKFGRYKPFRNPMMKYLQWHNRPGGLCKPYSQNLKLGSSR